MCRQDSIRPTVWIPFFAQWTDQTAATALAFLRWREGRLPIVCCACAATQTDDCKTTTDLGQALIDGKFDHVGKIKGPILRGLSARAPYFHNGSAQTLLDAVRFYEKRFGLVLTSQEESDLVAFLSSL